MERQRLSWLRPFAPDPASDRHVGTVLPVCDGEITNNAAKDLAVRLVGRFSGQGRPRSLQGGSRMRFFSVACAPMLFALTLFAGPTSAQGQTLVGDWGDPQRIVIEGTHAWSADEVRAELAADLEVILAAHPAAPFKPYPELLASRVRDGYRNEGFTRASASTKSI